MKKRWYPAAASLVLVSCNHDYSVDYGPCVGCVAFNTGGTSSYGNIDGGPDAHVSSHDEAREDEDGAVVDTSIDAGMPSGSR